MYQHNTKVDKIRGEKEKKKKKEEIQPTRRQTVRRQVKILTH